MQGLFSPHYITMQTNFVLMDVMISIIHSHTEMVCNFAAAESARNQAMQQMAFQEKMARREHTNYKERINHATAASPVLCSGYRPVDDRSGKGERCQI